MESRFGEAAPGRTRVPAVALGLLSVLLLLSGPALTLPGYLASWHPQYRAASILWLWGLLALAEGVFIAIGCLAALKYLFAPTQTARIAAAWLFALSIVLGCILVVLGICAATPALLSAGDFAFLVFMAMLLHFAAPHLLLTVILCAAAGCLGWLRRRRQDVS